ncbi:hypothetical protein HPB50_021359 [Hyalomma asiaticum]|uniref:Uncharacterized protein n=1 Tax=Hyalomma asiaticum TaxID=266040 RepID=A0ACB7SSI9_HYAAI|nr:hypothetical protein HPB50_021359 [Hyalomma asiaticum]
MKTAKKAQGQRRKGGRTNDIAAKGEPATSAYRELHRYNGAPEQNARLGTSKASELTLRESISPPAKLGSTSPGAKGSQLRETKRAARSSNRRAAKIFTTRQSSKARAAHEWRNDPKRKKGEGDGGGKADLSRLQKDAGVALQSGGHGRYGPTVHRSTRTPFVVERHSRRRRRNLATGRPVHNRTASQNGGAAREEPGVRVSWRTPKAAAAAAAKATAKCDSASSVDVYGIVAIMATRTADDDEDAWETSIIAPEKSKVEGKKGRFGNTKS